MNLSDDALDLLLDQEGLEVDPLDRLEEDTPLHKAVRFVNGLSKSDWPSGSALVELLLDAGADPRFVPQALMPLSRRDWKHQRAIASALNPPCEEDIR